MHWIPSPFILSVSRVGVQSPLTGLFMMNAALFSSYGAARRLLGMLSLLRLSLFHVCFGRLSDADRIEIMYLAIAITVSFIFPILFVFTVRWEPEQTIDVAWLLARWLYGWPRGCFCRRYSDYSLFALLMILITISSCFHVDIFCVSVC
jgi:hypothetical protein